jgi:flagellar hook protein FlgE
MSPISGIALSGMSAAQTRLAAAANNIANAGTAGYQRLRVETLPGPGGVSTVVSREPEAAPGLYVEDAVEMLAAKQAFIANALVLRTEDRMIGSLLDVLA